MVSMNGTARAIIPATITDIGDGPFFYAACQECYSKLFEYSGFWSCWKCRRKLPFDQVEFRYRLSMTITDGSTYAVVTAFGGTLNAFFGCSATEFNNRWIEKLQYFWGTLERPVTKWAVEESMLGCHLHFGFKVSSQSLCTQKISGNHGLSLLDIQQQSNECQYSPQTEKSLVAVQVICQNDSQQPTPITVHLQNVLSSFTSGDYGNSIGINVSTPHCVQIEKLIQEKYSRNHQRDPIQSKSFHNVSDSDECVSVLSSCDQSSIAFTCSNSVKKTKLLSKTSFSTSHHCEIDKNSIKHQSMKRIKNSYVIPPKSCNGLMEEQGCNIEEARAKCVYSPLLFDSFISCANEPLELPRSDLPMNDDTFSGLFNEKAELSEIEATHVLPNPSYLESDLFKSEGDGKINISSFLLHSFESEMEQKTDFERQEYIEKSQIAHDCHKGIQQHQESKITNSKYQNGRDQYLPLTSSISIRHSKLNDKSHSHLKTSNSFSQNGSVGTLAPHLAPYSTGTMYCSVLQPFNKNPHVFLDMPDSEDLELFLAAANYSAIQHNTSIPHNTSLSCLSKKMEKENVVETLRSPAVNISKMKHSHIHQNASVTINENHYSTTNSQALTIASIDCKTHPNRQEMILGSSKPGDCGSKFGHDSLCPASYSHLKQDESMGRLASNQKTSTCMSTKHYRPASFPSKSHGQHIRCSDSQNKNCDTNLASRLDSCKAFSSECNVEQSEMNESGDLFSSQESQDSHVLLHFKKLSIEDERALLSNKKADCVSESSNINCTGSLKVSQDNDDHVAFSDELSSSQNDSFDLFYSQSSTACEYGIVGGYNRSPEFSKDSITCNNSFDLFSSEEDNIM